MKLFLSLCAVVISVTGLIAGPNDPQDEQQVMATMETMARATRAKDVAVLSTVYHPDLTYSHSSGATQNRAEVLKALAGATIYDAIEFSNTTVRIYGPVALVKGVTHIHAHSQTQKYDTYLNILWVLAKGPSGWQIVARQPTQIPAP